MQWTDLTAEQRAVLLNAVEHSYLDSLLMEWIPGKDWPERLPEVPRLARAIEELADQGLIEMTEDTDQVGQPPIDVPADRLHEVVSNPANWWSPEGTGPFALSPTDEGLAVFRTSTRDNLYDFHQAGSPPQ